LNAPGLLVAVDRIDALPGQPRRLFAGIAELAGSIREHGVLEPVVLRPVGERFQIIAGERRLRAARLAGLAEIPAVVRDVTEREAFELALVENVVRENLTPIEEAEAFRRLQDVGKTQSEIGRLIGKTQSYVAQKLRLLTLPDFLTVFLSSGTLTEGHLRQLLRLRDIYPEDHSDLVGDFTEEAVEAYPQIIYSVLRPQASEGAAWASVPPVAVDALHLLNGYVTRHRAYGPPDWRKAEVPAWAVSALWFAADSVRSSRSVAGLSDAIDQWASDLCDEVTA